MNKSFIDTSMQINVFFILLERESLCAEKFINEIINEQCVLHRADRYVSRILNISYMKSWIEGRRRALLGSTTSTAHFN